MKVPPSFVMLYLLVAETFAFIPNNPHVSQYQMRKPSMVPVPTRRPALKVLKHHDSNKSVDALEFNNHGIFLTGTTSSTTTAPSRRLFLVGLGGTVTGMFGIYHQSALAIPYITVDEFQIILRDSPSSISVVEFSGPKSETVIVRLVDGTSFGIKDVVESATDPRSPLKVAAACRENNVKARFVDLETFLSKSTNKKKMYTNQRVQEAQEKEREKQERMRRDEEQRLAALKKLEEEEEAAAAAAAAAASSRSSDN